MLPIVTAATTCLSVLFAGRCRLVSLSCLLFFSAGFLLAQETAPELVALADRYLTEGDENEAAKLYRKALDLDSGLIDAYIGLARVALEKEEWKDASDNAEKALDRDPEDTTAHYYYAISHRERARYRTIAQIIHWTKGVNHFEWVIERDSLFRDVLYQFALLRRYQEKFDQAIDLAETQVRLRPELDDARMGLFRIYKHYLHLTRPQKAYEWLRSHPSDYAFYYSGEALRMMGENERADSVFAAVLESKTLMPVQPVLLSRARVHYALGDSLQAQQFVDQAIASISSKFEADLVMEDFKYLLDDYELEAYREIETPEGFRSFFHGFWAKRDPLPASPVNVRLQEHYRRLRLAEKDYGFHGFRTWHNNPDRLGELDFTAAYELNREFNDRGLILIRHGEPDDRVTTIRGAENQNESWRYNSSPRLDFHFERVPDGQATNSWRLAPRPPLAGRDTWGGRYAFPIRSELEYYERMREIGDTSREHVLIGLQTERHTWPKDVEPYDFPFLISSFRGEDGLAEIEIHYAVPIDELADMVGDSLASLEIEFGYAVHDTAWQPVGQDLRAQLFDKGDRLPEDNVDFFRVSARPDSYHVALHSRLTGHPNYLGGYRQGYRVPDYDRPGVDMSDLLPADRIEPASGQNRFNRGGLYVLPAPDLSFSVREPFYVYFEVYDLATGSDGLTRFSLEYELRPRKGRGRFFGLFGRDDRPVLTLRTDQSGNNTSPVEHAAIDASKVDPGNYSLIVRVIDHVAGTEVERSRSVELTK